MTLDVGLDEVMGLNPLDGEEALLRHSEYWSSSIGTAVSILSMARKPFLVEPPQRHRRGEGVSILSMARKPFLVVNGKGRLGTGKSLNPLDGEEALLSRTSDLSADGRELQSQSSRWRGSPS